MNFCTLKLRILPAEMSEDSSNSNINNNQMAVLENCSMQVKERARDLERLGFGFQFAPPIPKREDYFVICTPIEVSLCTQLESLKELAACQTLCLAEGYLQDFSSLLIHWSEYAKISNVINVLILKQVAFKLENALGVYYDGSATTADGERFSTYTMELKFLKQFDEGMNLFDYFSRNQEKRKMF